MDEEINLCTVNSLEKQRIKLLKYNPKREYKIGKKIPCLRVSLPSGL